jgi:Collagen triple helix repeat (20 copies)
MMSIVVNQRSTAILCAAGTLLAASLAAAPQADAAALYACVKKNGTARIFKKKPKCRKGETKLSWNVGGPAGKNGANGSNGSNGSNGPNGKEGIAGKEGKEGTATGARGETGAAGTNGTTGTNGVTGATGATGQTGASGTNGTNGVIGVTGAIGATGETGAGGTNGTNGTNGTTGTNGATGATGANGAVAGYAATQSGVVNITSGKEVLVVSKTLPAGHYLVSAKVETSGKATGAGLAETKCDLFEGTTLLDSSQWTGFLSQLVVGTFLGGSALPLQAPLNTSATSTLSLTCETLLNTAKEDELTASGGQLFAIQTSSNS